MRDSMRIDMFAYELAEFWKRYFPDWRFMQVICNFQSWLGSDGFYLEESEFMAKFEKFIHEMVKEK